MLAKNLEISLHKALSIAREYKHEYSTLEHLLLALTEDPDAKTVLTGCNVNIGELVSKLKNFLQTELNALIAENIKETKPTAGFQRVVHRAAIHAHATGKKEVNGANVLAEIFSEHESYAAYFLNEYNITRLDVLNYLAHGMVKYENLSNEERNISNGFAAVNKNPDEESEADEENNDSSVSQKDTKESLNALNAYCINLNKKAEEEEIDILIGREEEIERTIEILCRRTKNNPLYVGEPGVGKTAIAEGLALRIVRGNVPAILKNAVIFALDMGALVAGTRYRGDFEERIKTVIKEIQKLPYAVLFIDEIHTIIGAGSTNGSSLDAGNLLKPALARGNFRCIGSTTFKEYQTHFEKDRALVRRFQRIVVEAPSVENTIKILRGLKPYYEDHHKVHYTAGAIEAAVTLSERYINDRNLPDKAIDVLDEAGAHQKLITGSKQRRVVTVKDIENIISKIVHIPTKSISTDDAQKLQNLETNLKSVIYGQDKAIQELASAIKLARAGLRNHKKPIGSYLFSGPTGVGKTELARQLAQLISMELLRFDMSEYMEQHSVSRLIGSPPGYVGFDQGGLLTDAVNKTPYAVVLLDEIEKAHHDVYNLLLQIMDYGKLTDHNGRNINFCNTIVIMTTNAGAYEMSKSPLGFGREEREGEDKEQIEKLFTPEFRARLDAVIPFSPLSSETIKAIVDKFIQQLEAQLADKGIRIEIDKEVRKFLAIKGYDKKSGARKLEKLLDEKIKKSLADEILFGKLVKGGKVQVFLDGENFKFKFEEKRRVKN
jgi:ATP-dependent Clp protease ATP-binding subunit ClpA